MTEPVTEGAANPAVSEFKNAPEFKAAVQDAVEEILLRLGHAPGAEASQPGQPDHVFAKDIAMAIATLTDQGVGRQRRVAPEVLHARDAARERMKEAVLSARAEGRVGTYRLRNKVYLDEVLVDPVFVSADHIQRPTEIDWPGIPNEAMEPVNDTAKEIHRHFMDSIGSVVKVVADGDMRITAGGLVVKGRPQPVRSGPSGDAASEGLRIHHRDRPGQYVETRVLGTVAAPARQTA